MGLVPIHTKKSEANDCKTDSEGRQIWSLSDTFSLPFLFLWVFSQSKHSLLSVSLGSMAAHRGREKLGHWISQNPGMYVQMPSKMYRIHIDSTESETYRI